MKKPVIRTGSFLLIIAVAIGLLIALPMPATATSVTFGYNGTFSGWDPVGDPTVTPWLTATFDDGGTAGSVTLTLNADGLTANENIKELYFNLDPVLNPTALTISEMGSTSFLDSYSLGADAFKADGVGGLYDILLSFKNKNSDRFGEDDIAVFSITGISALTAESFDFLSTPDGGGSFLSAAHVRSIGQEDLSGWIAPVPEPGTLLLLGSGLTALGVFGRKRFRPKK